MKKNRKLSYLCSKNACNSFSFCDVWYYVNQILRDKKLSFLWFSVIRSIFCICVRLSK